MKKKKCPLCGYDRKETAFARWGRGGYKEVICTYCDQVIALREEKVESDFFMEKIDPAPWASLTGGNDE